MLKVSCFVKRATALRRKLKNTSSSLSLKLFNDGKVLPRLEEGGTVYAHVLERGYDNLIKLERDAGIEPPKPAVK